MVAEGGVGVAGRAGSLALRGDGGSLPPPSCHTQPSMLPLGGTRLPAPSWLYTQVEVPGSMYQYDQ
ncbi:hypothetical protein [Kitasatospora sp. NPDC093679]|uniref:hypothetical protein n=1 Tax=Kitasatospora sp. NPDC093679 TaxID=3154983 RepID=UPI00342F6D64